MKLAGILLLLLSGIGLFFLLDYKRKGKLDKLTNNQMYLAVGGLSVVTFISLLLFAFGIRNESKIDINTGRIIFIISMSLLLTLSIYYFIMAIWLRKNVFTDEENNKKIRKVMYITSIISGILIIFLVTGYLESIAPFLTYPLNKLVIDFGNGRGITFYAVVIIIGALTTYFISDYYVAKAGYGHGQLETCLYLAFPAGIIGGRLWYVIANWNIDFAGRPFENVFYIWNGGLAIQGGVLLGAAVGIAYMMRKHKNIPILFLIDTIVPAILLAQAIGRWGNFTNKEVYGSAVAVSNFPWSILPTWIKNQMMVDGDPTKIYVPLFLIEGICNVAGYFLIAYGAGRGLKKYLVPGDQGLLYLVVYGVIRFFLEPLRDPEFIMGVGSNGGDGVMRSSVMAILFIVAGILGIVVLHVLDYRKKKQNKVKDEQPA